MARPTPSPRCLCGHAQSSHYPWAEFADGDFGAHCVPTRGKQYCGCRGWAPPQGVESPPCPMGVASHSWCSCVAGQQALL